MTTSTLPTDGELGIDALFESARSHNGWLDKPIAEGLLKEVYERSKWGPTSMNLQPMRVLFLVQRAQRERLIPALKPANVSKVIDAPVTALIAWDVAYYKRLPQLFGHRPEYQAMYEKDSRFAEQTAFRNSSMQGAYFMLAARSLGLDCGPMSGFDEAKVNEEFFPDGGMRVNFICSIGYGDQSKLYPRSPRLPFDEACQML